jgi:hypothetical protein
MLKKKLKKKKLWMNLLPGKGLERIPSRKKSRSICSSFLLRTVETLEWLYGMSCPFL